jgi:hypothetical protein
MAQIAGYLNGEHLEAGFRSARDPTTAVHPLFLSPAEMPLIVS